MSLRSEQGLPLPEVRRAAQEVDAASRRLAATLAHAPYPHLVRALRTALEHLDSAAGALLLAQHSIQGYLATVDALPPGPASTGDAVRPNWWVERVAQLTQHSPESRQAAGTGAGPPSTGAGPPSTGAGPPSTSAELLRIAVDRAQAGDRAGFADVLASAGQAVGLGLAALTAPLIRRYAAELADPSPALDTVRHLLPALPDGLAGALLAAAPDRPWDSHPADTAIAGTALVAGLLNLLGRNGLPELPEHHDEDHD